MNEDAYDIKMESSNFENPHGLSNSENVSNCSDISLLIQKAFEYEVFKEVIKTKQHKCKVTNAGQERLMYWENTNKLLSRDDCIGVKTGVTPAAGPCMSVAFENGMKVLLVILLKS